MMTIEEKREKNRIKNNLWRKKNHKRYLACAAKFRRNNRPKIADYKLKVRYGISLEDYNGLFKKQNGKCAICKNEETALHSTTRQKQKLAVDHCHKTGKVRELLCQDCNRGIAKFREDPIRLQNAIEYLKWHM
jgi:hypothetical protein